MDNTDRVATQSDLTFVHLFNQGKEVGVDTVEGPASRDSSSIARQVSQYKFLFPDVSDNFLKFAVRFYELSDKQVTLHSVRELVVYYSDTLANHHALSYGRSDTK